MPELDAQITFILLLISGGTLVLVLAAVLWIARRLGQIERLILRNLSSSGASELALAAAETVVTGAFDVFLSEDPERRRLTKGEQFAAYRRWRQEKGMNWSAPEA